MDEQIEQIARAIYDASHSGISNCYSWDDAWEDHQEPQRQRYYKEARAAHRVMAGKVAELEEALSWAENHDPKLVGQIRARAAALRSHAQPK